MREGMSTLVAELRLLTDAARDEYTVGGIEYWGDDQLQSILDQHRTDVYRAQMIIREEYDAGSARYRNYYYNARWAEGTASGPEAWEIETTDGRTVTNAYTPNPGYVRFDEDQRGSIYYLSFRAYDLYSAAADIWSRKAGHVAGRFDVQTDNHKLSRSQLMRHYMAQAQNYRELSIIEGGALGDLEGGTGFLRRTDAY